MTQAYRTNGHPVVTTTAQPGPPAPEHGPHPPVVIHHEAPPPSQPDRDELDHPEVIVVSHSPLVYWWPVWVTGNVMAGLTWWYG